MCPFFLSPCHSGSRFFASRHKPRAVPSPLRADAAVLAADLSADYSVRYPVALVQEIHADAVVPQSPVAAVLKLAEAPGLVRMGATGWDTHSPRSSFSAGALQCPDG